MPVYGEGIELNISVVNIEDKTVILGTPQIGNLVSKSVKVVNKCPIAVKATFDIADRLQNTNVAASNTHYLEQPVKTQILKDEIGTR